MLSRDINWAQQRAEGVVTAHILPPPQFWLPNFSEIQFWLANIKNFRANLTKLEGERTPKKRNFLVNFLNKVLKMSF